MAKGQQEIDGLTQKWRNSSALAMELHLFDIKPLNQRGNHNLVKSQSRVF